MKLFFDVETTGRPDLRLPADAPCQPRVVQLAFMLTDEDGDEHASFSAIIRPDGWTIPQETTDIHGITTAHAKACGIALWSALDVFLSYLTVSREIIAHNIDFDLFLMRGELLRIDTASAEALDRPTRVCTMLDAAPVLKMRGSRPGQWKWPKLIEAYHHFYGRDFEKAHDAMADVRACAAVHFALLGRPFKLPSETAVPVPVLAAKSDELSNGFTWQDLAECAKRETRMRQRVFPKRVLTGEMDRRTADRETEMMRTIGRVFDNMTMAELPLS